MRERPILFSAPMVRALLKGQKTKTRRALNERDIANFTAAADLGECGRFLDGQPIDPRDRAYHSMLCRYGEPGDRLYVRETWHTDEHDLKAARAQHEDVMSASPIYFRADPSNEGAGCIWMPSIHMPKWASRILLEITATRIERLHEITDVEAIDEGVLSIRSDEWDRKHFPTYTAERDHAYATRVKPPLGPTPRRTFQALWESINGKASWTDNPWVWVVEFRRIEMGA